MKREFKFAVKVWAYYLVMVILCMMFTLGIGNVIIKSIMDAGLILGFAFISFSEGGYMGEKAVALIDSIQKQEKEGRRVLEELRGQVFNRAFAAKAFVIAILPFMLVCGVNAAFVSDYALPETTAIIEEVQTAEEAEVAAEETAAAETAEESTEETAGEAAEEETGNTQVTGAERSGHWARVMSWTVFVPFSTLNQRCSDGLNAILFFVYSLILPAAASVGYLFGPKLHERKIKQMKKGSRRKARGLKVNKTPKPPKAEV